MLLVKKLVPVRSVTVGVAKYCVPDALFVHASQFATELEAEAVQPVCMPEKEFAGGDVVIEFISVSGKIPN